MSDVTKNSEWNKRKRKLAAPCGHLDGAKKHTIYPQVYCGFDCERCGWNPDEKKRRLETGEMKPVKEKENLSHLVFKRKEKANVQLERQDH